MPLHLAESVPAPVRGRAMVFWPLYVSSFKSNRRPLTSSPSNRVLGAFEFPLRSLLLWASIPLYQYVTRVHISIIPVAASLILSLRYMTLESPYQLVARGHIASALQTLYKSRLSKIVAARDLYRIYATSSFESSLASQSARRATTYSITFMLTRALIISPELLTEHLLNRPETDISRLTLMISSKGFGLGAIAIIWYWTDCDRLGERRFMLLRVLIMQLLYLILPLDPYVYDSLVYFCIQIALSVGLSVVTMVYAVEVFPYSCRGMDSSSNAAVVERLLQAIKQYA